MNKPSVMDYQRLETERDVTIARAQLPLYCPRDGVANWCAHPRVFLPIEASPNQTCRCPYCGTLYHLES